MCRAEGPEEEAKGRQGKVEAAREEEAVAGTEEMSGKVWELWGEKFYTFGGEPPFEYFRGQIKVVEEITPEMKEMALEIMRHMESEALGIPASTATADLPQPEITFEKIAEIYEEMASMPPRLVCVHCVDCGLPDLLRKTKEGQIDRIEGVELVMWSTLGEYPEKAPWYVRVPGIWLEMSDGSVRRVVL